MRRRELWRRIFAGALVVALGVALASTVPARAAAVTVAVGPASTDGYNPNGRTDTIAPGQTVDWTWQGGPIPHTVTFSDGPDSGQRTTGTYSRTFPSPGTFSYHCVNHANMTGTVVVQSSATTSPPTTAAPRPPATAAPARSTTTARPAAPAPPTTTSPPSTSTTAGPAAAASDSATTSTSVAGRDLAATVARHRRSSGHPVFWIALVVVLVLGGGVALWVTNRYGSAL